MTDAFKWRHYESEIILTCVRWYLRYSLSYRDLEEMMTERNLSVDLPRSFAGFNDMLLNSMNDADLISSKPTIPGV